MEKKVKFIWLYSVVLFSAALILILISALAHMRLSPLEDISGNEVQTRTFNQTAQQNIASVIEENALYRAEIEVLQARADVADSLMEQLLQQDAIFRARNYYDNGYFEDAYNTLLSLDDDLLSLLALSEYQLLMEKVSRETR